MAGGARHWPRTRPRASQLEADPRERSRERKAESFWSEDEALWHNGGGRGGRLSLRRWQNVSLRVEVVV